MPDASTLDWVRLYRSLGWAPIRVPPASKAPLDPGWPTLDYPDASFAPGDNIGVKLGQPSGGLVDVDLDCPEAVALAPLYLPPTATFGRTGPGSTPAVDPKTTWASVGPARHYVYICPQGVKSCRPTRTHVELRSTGSQTVMPGSVHTSGDPIQWVTWPPDGPAQIDTPTLERAFAHLCIATSLARLWPTVKGDRHHLILALAGALWHAGWTHGQAAHVLLPAIDLDGTLAPHRAHALTTTWEPGDKPRLGWPSVEQILGVPDTTTLQRHVDRIPRVRRESDSSPAVHNLHDTGNAERLLAESPHLRHVRGVGWLRWTGTVWGATDPSPDAIVGARKLLKDAESTGDVAAQKWGHQSLSSSRIHATVTLAAAIDDRTLPSDLDSDSWLLSVSNGVVDLRTGTMQSHDPNLLITRASPVAYDPQATCPRFCQFLNEVFNGDISVIEYVLRYLGYGLTGDVREQCLAVWYGHGANGKSTLIDVLLQVMGGYAQKMPADLLTAGQRRSSSGPSPDLARMRGARMVAGAETGEGARWDEPLVKSLTGGDRIVARHLHQEPIEFAPTWKLVLAVNHKPIVRGADHGIWRRIHLVPFNQKFDGVRQDRNLLPVLLEELPGILALFVRGCLDWQRQGLALPPVLQVEADRYRQEHDTIGSFLLEMSRQKYGAKTSKTQLYRTYRSWAAESGEYVHSRSTFTRLLRERNLTEDPRHWLDIELLLTP